MPMVIMGIWLSDFDCAIKKCGRSLLRNKVLISIVLEELEAVWGKGHSYEFD